MYINKEIRFDRIYILPAIAVGDFHGGKSFVSIAFLFFSLLIIFGDGEK